MSDVAQPLFIIRHGETDYNRAHRLQGHLDIPLNERGRQQADRLADFLASLQPRAVFSSPLARALDTARRALAGLPEHLSDLRLDERLAERGYGVMEGLTLVEAFERHPHYRDPYYAHRQLFRPEGGESYGDVAERLSSFTWEQLAGRLGPVVLFAHGGVARVLTGLLLPELPPADLPRIIVPNTSLLAFSKGSNGASWAVAHRHPGGILRPGLPRLRPAGPV